MEKEKKKKNNIRIMRVSKATKENIDDVIHFMQVMDQLATIDIEDKSQWEKLKEDWGDTKAYSKIIHSCENNTGFFDPELFFSYFQRNISHNMSKILFGYETLVDNCCDSDKDYLDFNSEIKKGLDLVKNKIANEKN